MDAVMGHSDAPSGAKSPLSPCRCCNTTRTFQQPAFRGWSWLKKTPRPRPCFFPEVVHSRGHTNRGVQGPSSIAPTWDNLVKDHPSFKHPGGVGRGLCRDRSAPHFSLCSRPLLLFLPTRAKFRSTL